MLQDLEYGRLENEFRHTAPVATAKVVCAQGSRLLVKRKEDDTLVLPTYAEVMAWAKEKGWTHWDENGYSMCSACRRRITSSGWAKQVRLRIRPSAMSLP